ncbi:MAG: class I SAM-dependent methyltransferase [Clostridia bacterium]|nr:class I SAM-dependent methyltransferase [Clostridia bacterium]
MILINALALSHYYAKKSINTGDTVIDATCGMGRDTLFLANLVGSKGRVYAFDIQKDAVSATEKLLKASGIDNATILCESHSKMKQHVQPGVSCVMFNLGYLPGGDHSVQTNGNTTLAALLQAMDILKTKGIITIVIYQGGDTGFAERDQVLDFCRTIDQDKFTVSQTSFINQKNHPPIFICIEKL